MSPRRPPHHVNADRAIFRLQAAFIETGCTVEELRRDYGEDLLVRLFNQEEASSFFFYVQAKSTSNPDRYLTRDNQFMRYPFDSGHLKIWREFWEPVVLAIWDAKNDVIYWEIAQEPQEPWDTKAKNSYCRIPTSNILDEIGIKRLAARTRRRHRRFEREREGAQILIEKLKDLSDIEIDYNPQAGILYTKKPDSEAQITFFGKMAEKVTRAAAKAGLPEDEYVNRAIIQGSEIYMKLADGATLQFTDSEGVILKEWNKEELDDHLQKMEDLDEP